MSKKKKAQTMKVNRLNIKYGLPIITIYALVALGAVFFASAGTLVTKTSAKTCMSATDFKNTTGLGNACKLPNGIYKVKLGDGTISTLHAPDPIDEIVKAKDNNFGPPIPPACIASSDYHFEALYVRPPNSTDNYTTIKPNFINMINQANGFMHEEGAEFAKIIDYKFLCENNLPLIKNVILGSNMTTFNWSAIITAIKAKIPASTKAKYWIYWDGPSSGYGGLGEWCQDDRNITANCNNTGPSYALNDHQTGLYGSLVFLHEVGHTMGAVQTTSPNSDGGAHCKDGDDVMCFSGGGPECLDRKHFDCNHNDYFNPTPAVGSYLKTHWNLGSTNNKFLQIK